MKCFNASMLFLASILLPSMLMGQVIVSDQNVILYPDVTDGDTTNFEIGVFQDAAATDITHTLFGLTGSELVITGMSRDEGSEWYLGNFRDSFSRTSIDQGRHASIGDVFHPSVDIGVNDNFYLAFSTGRGLDFSNDRTVYGWLQIGRDSGNLTLLDSAIGYDTGGIIVGAPSARLAPSAVPEPSTATGFLASLLLAMLKRRRANA